MTPEQVAAPARDQPAVHGIRAAVDGTRDGTRTGVATAKVGGGNPAGDGRQGTLTRDERLAAHTPRGDARPDFIPSRARMTEPTAWRRLVAEAFRVGGGPNRLLRVFLWGLAAASSLRNLPALIEGYPKFADVEIPLRAAARWLSGGEAYLASAFQAPAGYELPFLYPPLTLPLFAPATALPRPMVYALWIGTCAAAAWWLLRRLGVPARFAAPLMLWPPFFEGLLGGNLQVLLVAGFVAVFFDRARADWRPEPRDPARGDRPPAVDGVLAAAIATLKISQPHAWLGLFRRRPGAAVAGLGVVAAAAVATLPFVGLSSWPRWVEQLGRAFDPKWGVGGSSLAAGAPPEVAVAVLLVSLGLCLAAPRGRIGAWVGVLTILGAPSLRMFGLLFAVPAMLVIRRELALIAAAFIATYSELGLWLGIFLVAGSLFLADHFSALRESGPPDDAAKGPPGPRRSKRPIPDGPPG
jgi:Glycosyltransferase family 87